MPKRVSYTKSWGGLQEGPRKARRTLPKAKELNITSLIDILTILLVFLLKNISMEVQKLELKEKMKLPESSLNEKELLAKYKGQLVTVQLFSDKIWYDGITGITSMSVQYPVTKGANNTVFFDPRFLSALKDDQRIIEEQQLVPALLIQADKKLPCEHVKNLLVYATSQAQFGNIFFATILKG